MRLTKTLIASSLLLLSIIIILFLYYSKENVKSLKIIRIGYAVEAPYAFVEKNGTITGESPEVAKVIAHQLGYDSIEWVQTEFHSLISGLLTNQFDVIAAGMFITPYRATLVNFSEPTFHVQQALLVPIGNPAKIHSYADLIKNANLKVAVIEKSVEGAYLKRVELNENRLIYVPDAISGKAAVENGIADCLAISSPTIQWMALHNNLGKTEMAVPFKQEKYIGNHLTGYGAFAFRKSDKRLCDDWNAKLKAYIGSPNHLKLISKFGFNKSELPNNVTTNEIIPRQ